LRKKYLNAATADNNKKDHAHDLLDYLKKNAQNKQNIF